MAKMDLTCAVTVNYQSKTIEFMKLSASLNEIDLSIPMETQLETFDEKFGYAYNELGSQIREKLKTAFNVEKAG